MAYDLFEGLEEIPGFFGEELFEDERLQYYNNPENLGNLNSIAAINLEFTIDHILPSFGEIDPIKGTTLLAKISKALDNNTEATDVLQSRSEELQPEKLGYLATAYTLRYAAELDPKYIPRFLRYVGSVADMVQDAQDNDRLSVGIETLADRAKNDQLSGKTCRNPKSLFQLAIDSDTVWKYGKTPAARRIPYEKLSPEIQVVLASSNNTTFGQHCQMMAQYPVTRFLEGTGFLNASSDYARLRKEFEREVSKHGWMHPREESELERKVFGETYFGFIDKLVGRNTKREKFDFFHDLYSAVGKKWLDLGVTLPKLLFKMVKDDPNLRETCTTTVPKIVTASFVVQEAGYHKDILRTIREMSSLSPDSLETAVTAVVKEKEVRTYHNLNAILRGTHLGKTIKKRLVELPASVLSEVETAAFRAMQLRMRSDFLLGFSQALENQEVEQWAQHILDQLEEPVIGGGNYREASACQ